MPKGGKKIKIKGKSGSAMPKESNKSRKRSMRSRSESVVEQPLPGSTSNKQRRLLDENPDSNKNEEQQLQIAVEINPQREGNDVRQVIDRGEDANNNAQRSHMFVEQQIPNDDQIADDGVRVTVNESEDEEFDYNDLDEEADDFAIDAAPGPSEVGDSEITFRRRKANNELKTPRRTSKGPAGLDDLFNEFLEEKLVEAQRDGQDDRIHLIKKLTGKNPEKNTTQLEGKKGKFSQSNGNSQGCDNALMKSPSDTTVYAPALTLNKGPTSPVGTILRRNKQTIEGNTDLSNMLTGDDDEIISRISNFVDAVRLEQRQQGQQEEKDDDPQPRIRSAVEIPGQEEAEKRADNAVLEAEKYKATINDVPGRSYCSCSSSNDSPQAQGGHMSGNNFQNARRLNIGTGVSDDDFFHLTSFIEDGLRKKIENGDYVELERLLPKDRFNMWTSSDSETKMIWVQRPEGTFLVPEKRDIKINSFKRWEQAFRAYATIYCTAQPDRAREIWQYISVINTAASSYIWENVYNYDVVFRQLMEFNKNRSWAVTYNQMWNLTMKDPLPRNPVKFNMTPRSNQFARNNGDSNNDTRNLLHKPDYCWSFNKGQTCKYGRNCKYIERCSYCDAVSHGVIVCPKANKKDVKKLLSAPPKKNSPSTSTSAQSLPKSN